MWTLKKCLSQNVLNFGPLESAFPLHKCPRDWEQKKKKLKKADEIIWRQLVYSGFASDSGHGHFFVNQAM